jgi:hypothetical protein
VAALLSRFRDDIASTFLPDDLVDESVGDLDVLARLDVEATEQVAIRVVDTFPANCVILGRHCPRLVRWLL